MRSTARTCSLTPATGLPAVLSASAWKASFLSVEAQFSALIAATTDDGHNMAVLLSVCTSPFGSEKLASNSRLCGALDVGIFWMLTLPLPLASSVSGSLSAMTRRSLL